YRGSVVRLNQGTQPETSQEEPASQRPRNSSVPSCRPTQKWGSTRKGLSRYLQARERGRTRQTPFRHRDWSEPKPASNQACGIRVEALSAVSGVNAPGEKMHRKTRLNPARSQLGVRLAGLAPSSR